LLTSTKEPGKMAAPNASWMLVAAVAQLVYGGMGLVLVSAT